MKYFQSIDAIDKTKIATESKSLSAWSKERRGDKQPNRREVTLEILMDGRARRRITLTDREAIVSLKRVGLRSLSRWRERSRLRLKRSTDRVLSTASDR